MFPETVTVIAPKAFRRCSALSDVTITKQITGIETLAFYGCGSLKEAMLPLTVSNVAEDAFPTTARIYVHKGAAAAEALSSHPNLRFLEGSFGTKREWSLEDGTLTVSGEDDMPDWEQLSATPWNDLDSKIVDITVESGVTNIGKNAFYGCVGLTDVSIADTVKAVGDNAFRECGRLTGITLSEGVTRVGRGMFYGCASLAEVTLPYSVGTIASDAFTGCPASMVICSYAGSGAEKYASKYGFTFRAHTHDYEFDGRCGEVIAERQTVPVAHRIVLDQAAIAATCTQAGMTAGSHCNVCGEVLTEQSTIPAIGHQWTEGVVTTKPTCMSKGLKYFYCTVWG